MILKPHRFDVNEISEYDGEEINCGCCNWETSTLYVLAENREKANEKIRSISGRELAGLCGECLCRLLTEENHKILNKTQREDMFKELEELYQILYEKMEPMEIGIELRIQDLQDKLIGDGDEQNQLTKEVNEEIHPI